jgi:RimJ/RimL family protein N-acetyltransferase/adenylylsulfate kinase-like enzyme
LSISVNIKFIYWATSFNALRMVLVRITDDVYLTPINAGDADTYVEIFKDERVTKTLLAVPYPYARSDAEWWINFNNELYNRESCHWNLAIRNCHENDRLIGGIGINSVSPDGAAEIGYFLTVSHWGKGLMTQVLRRWMVFIATRQQCSGGALYGGIKRFEAQIFHDNSRSGRVLMKAGFSFIKETPNAYTKNGVSIDGILYRCQMPLPSLNSGPLPTPLAARAVTQSALNTPIDTALNVRQSTMFVIRGPSGAGKSALANALCAELRSAGRAVAYFEQDHFRGGVMGSFGAVVAQYGPIIVGAATGAVSAGCDVVVEGMFTADKTSGLMVRLASVPGARIIFVYLEVPLEVALARHANRMKGGSGQVSAESVTEWYGLASPLGVEGEVVIRSGCLDLDATLQRVMKALQEPN